MREKIETIVLAMSICGVSIFLLLTGMSLSAMGSNNRLNIIQYAQTATNAEDIIDTVINEFSISALQEEFAGVKIITWDEYYELSGVLEERQYKRGIYGYLDENCWDMEEAGLLALKEVSSLESINMDGTYLMMALSNATSSQATEIWRGYLCNFLYGEAPVEEERLEYYIQVNALTGEVIRLEKKEGIGEARILLDTTNKVEVISDNLNIDYSTVPIYTVEDYFMLEDNGYGVTSEAYQYGEEGYLSMKEAGTIILKEIHKLFEEDMMGMKLVMSFSDGKWGGWLLNDYDSDNALYKNYSFRMDARNGKIWWLKGGLTNVTYTTKEGITNEEIVDSVRKMIQKYHLANVNTVDWSNVLVHNASASMTRYMADSTGEQVERITNYVEFYSDEGEHMRIDIDYETGELWQVLNKDYMYFYD